MTEILTRGLKPCNSWSPHEPLMKRENRGEKPVPARCNRPSGHDGNHMCLSRNFEKLAEWGQCEVVK